MPGEAPNILKAKFLIPSNLGGGPFLILDYFFNILQNIFEIFFLFSCFWFLKKFWGKGARSFGEKVAKHRLQSGAQGTGQK